MKPRDLTGQRFGRLVALERLPSRTKPNGKKYSVWRCECDCGQKPIASLSDLTTGNTKSCGCLATEGLVARSTTHGMSRTHPLYGMWCYMRARCENVKHKSYPLYGGRGITVCERWKNSFTCFAHDMGERPAGAEIERRDNDAGYSPDNCKWAFRPEQSRNRRSNIRVTINGETLCLLDWCKRLSLPYDTVRARIKKLKWPARKALGLSVPS